MAQGTVTTQPQGRSFIIKRPRLTKLLDESEARIILLVAPAGYGKTTLAREWVAGTEQPSAWYRATPASADVGALAPGIAAELESVLAESRSQLTDRVAALAAVQQKPEPLARALARESHSWPSNLTVVIDDYQELAISRAAEEFIGSLVTLLPVRFVITTRVTPVWLTARLAIYGEALEIGATELALTDPEIEEVFRRAQLRRPGGAMLAAAGGWPAVVGLAARSGKRNLPTNALPDRLYDFLANDLMASVSSAARQALTTLAISGTTDIDLAIALVGADAKSNLDEAHHRGLVNLEPEGAVTLHPLLRQLLIRTFREQSADTMRRLAAPTGSTLVRFRQWDECLELAAVGEDPAFVIAALEEAVDELLDRGRAMTVGRWVALARDLNVDAPIIDRAEGEVALRNGDFRRALALGARAASRSSAALLTRSQLLAARAASLVEDRLGAQNWFAAAEASAQDNRSRADAIWGQFVVQVEEEDDRMQSALERFAEASTGSVDRDIRLSQGRSLVGLHEGSVTIALTEARACHMLVPYAADHLVRLAAMHQYAWSLNLAGLYDEALEAAEQTFVSADELDIGFVTTHALVAKSRALVGLRHFGPATQLLSGMERRQSLEGDHWLTVNLAMLRARLCISSGDLNRAAEYLIPAADAHLPPAGRAEHEALCGLIDAARGKLSEARRWIDLCTPHSRNVEARGMIFATQCIFGLNRPSGRQLPETCSQPLEALIASGHHDALVLACRAQPELAKNIVRDGRWTHCLRSVLTASRDTALARAAGLEIPRAGLRAGPLSAREAEVYELMAQGRTNREISQTLFISESTTKVHVRHIFEKLGVRSRVEAVRAFE